MDFFFKKKTLPLIEHKKEINNQIQELFNLKTGIYIKVKEYETAIYINLFIDKRILDIDISIEKSKIPNMIILLLILNGNYPLEIPKIISKSNFSQPTLMDGRDLLNEICPNWNPKSGLKPILEGFLPFLSKVINAKGYKFYGMFHLGATYNLKNFDNMIVVIFDCTVEENENKNQFIKSLSTKANYELILTEDCLLLLEIQEKCMGKIAFWSSLFAITYLQLNKLNKLISLYFYDEKKIVNIN